MVSVHNLRAVVLLVLIQWNGGMEWNGMVEWSGMEPVLLQRSPTEWLASVPATYSHAMIASLW